MLKKKISKKTDKFLIVKILKIINKNNYNIYKFNPTSQIRNQRGITNRGAINILNLALLPIPHKFREQLFILRVFAVLQDVQQYANGMPSTDCVPRLDHVVSEASKMYKCG